MPPLRQGKLPQSFRQRRLLVDALPLPIGIQAERATQMRQRPIDVAIFRQDRRNLRARKYRGRLLNHFAHPRGRVLLLGHTNPLSQKVHYLWNLYRLTPAMVTRVV